MKEIRYWTSHPNTSPEWWYKYLGLKPESFQLTFDPVMPDYLLATEHIYTEWRAKIDFKRLYSFNRVVLFWAGECISPDMNLFDYATTFDKGMKLSDRIIRRPAVSFFGGFNKEPLNVIRNSAKTVLTSKNKFCNFIYTNAMAHPRRDALYFAISKYKHVDSLGRHLKNTDVFDSRGAVDFEAKSVLMKRPYKFSIAAENATAKGYVTEKLLTSFLAYTVPIYWGDPDVEEEFNPKAFINANTLNDDMLIKRVSEVDLDDGLWEEMVSQPLMTEEQHSRMLIEEMRYCAFMENVFGQSMKAALRRPQGYWSDNYRRTFFSAKAHPVGGSSRLRRLFCSGIQMLVR